MGESHSMASIRYSHMCDVLGVVGAGQMGAGIARLAANKGLDVLLYDAMPQTLERAMNGIKRHFDGKIAKGVMKQEDVEAALARIKATKEVEGLAKADLVIEAVTEDEKVKKEVFKTLDKVTPIHSVLASNTSSISITRLAAVTRKPHRIIGMHFMHPVHLAPIVELASGMHTSQQTLQQARSLAEHLGKTVCMSDDRPGFVVYRTLMPMINEAFFCMMEGVGTPDDIDRGIRLGIDTKMGPLRLADHIGLDTCLNILRVMCRDTGDSKYRPCPLLTRYVDGGLLGVKTGKGVFTYDYTHADKIEWR